MIRLSAPPTASADAIMMPVEATAILGSLAGIAELTKDALPKAGTTSPERRS